MVWERLTSVVLPEPLAKKFQQRLETNNIPSYTYNGHWSITIWRLFSLLMLFLLIIKLFNLRMSHRFSAIRGYLTAPKRCNFFLAWLNRKQVLSKKRWRLLLEVSESQKKEFLPQISSLQIQIDCHRPRLLMPVFRPTPLISEQEAFRGFFFLATAGTRAWMGSIFWASSSSELLFWAKVWVR